MAAVDFRFPITLFKYVLPILNFRERIPVTLTEVQHL